MCRIVIGLDIDITIAFDDLMGLCSMVLRFRLIDSVFAEKGSAILEMRLAVTSEASERLRYGGGTATPSFCSSRPVLTPVGSFRSTHLFNPSKMAADRYSVMSDAPQLTRYRDRAHSEVHKLERHNWKMKAETNRRTSFMVHATQV
ncbi:unnamed protein product [Timema podura]|uniref:Uncharacterized protein n=1 Tax=Timema podura TaxID=61482 RepID=A0ABN7NVB1_TIMPD|nr:unnamed protein product [Timema podura]